ncbi:hypothetical protein CERZMDRAFT_105324 [Cercospora zeae-maydis SCOH1-5]|uniref:Uncharacterized protein n=1 Tax=Cercospora zeae-maydis SCOH1-5 TaxID=717836 RepID=A0A6A6FN88_9PEZI|nr:hypothetical protein CERZMDRAFT_105324 [Cercospora zeae-maydis SCOH1-5]
MRLPGPPSTRDNNLWEPPSISGKRLPGQPSTGGMKMPRYGSLGGKKLPESVETGSMRLSELVPDTDLELDGDDDDVGTRIDDDAVGENEVVDDALSESRIDDDETLPEAERDKNTSLPARATIAETSCGPCTSSNEQVLTSPTARAKKKAPRKKNFPMKPAQQREMIERLQARLMLFPPFSKLEESAIVSPVSPAQIVPPAMPLSPISPHEDPKPVPNPPTKKRKRAKSTQTAQVNPSQSPEDIEPKHPKKQKSTTEDRYKQKIFKKIPPEAQRVMSTLQGMGRGVESSLDAVGADAKAVLSTARPGDNVAVNDELKEKAEAWKQSNREHLEGVVSLLERNGVLAIGAVEVPSGGGDVSRGFVQEFESAEGLFDGVEMGEDGEARFGELGVAVQTPLVTKATVHGTGT